MKVTGGYRAHRSLLMGDASFPSDGETQTSLPIFPGRSLWISVVSRVNKKDPSFGRKAEARRSGNYRDSDSCFGSKVRLNTASCGVLALIDMTICVTPQQRLIGRALYSHLREAIHTAARKKTRLLRRFAARHDVESAYDFVLRARRRRSPDGRSTIRDGDTDESHGSLRSHPGLPAHTPASARVA